MTQALTVVAPSADPQHPDYAKLLDGISKILSDEAPAIISLSPNSNKLGVIVMSAELGLTLAQSIAQLIAQLHPKK